MRRMLGAAALVALLGLSACEAQEQAAAPPPAPKSTARQQLMYAGQEQLQSVASASISVEKPGVLTMTANGATPTAGYSNLGFLRRIYPAPPKDGIYEMDVVGDKPSGAAAQAVTPVEVKGGWEPYPAEHLKGVKFITRSGSVVAMLPAASGKTAGAPAGQP
jgi:hypothetical protein